MENKKTITGFSKLSKRGKIKWIVENFFKNPESVMRELASYWHANEDQQKILDGFSENTISNFPMPFGVAPNFVINDKAYCIPMVIEESSVVAAASSAAKYWMDRGGFKAEIIGTVKLGQVHFKWEGKANLLRDQFAQIKARLIRDTDSITSNMRKRGGGILDIILEKTADQLPNHYQLKASFETCDSMGANFINSCLEQFAQSFKSYMLTDPNIPDDQRDVEIVMSILSNFTPQCTVKAWVQCPIEALGNFPNKLKAQDFAKKFKSAIDIAIHDPYRAVTHNKGIFNGIDAVVLATGNDFRAIESCGHAYAARDGQYRSLSTCRIENDEFYFELIIPLAVGTVGGLTSLHPMAKRSLELLENPKAEELMKIIAVTGLAQNFAAVRSLVTTGIQQGHMKMHLQNILNQLGTNEEEAKMATKHFEDKTISYSAVRDYILSIRSTIIQP